MSPGNSPNGHEYASQDTLLQYGIIAFRLRRRHAKGVSMSGRAGAENTFRTLIARLLFSLLVMPCKLQESKSCPIISLFEVWRWGLAGAFAPWRSKG